jgi:hypothetical protein
MPDSAVQSRASHHTAASDNSISPYGEFGLRVAERFGVPTVLLLAVIWWVKADIVQPLMTAHFEVVQKIISGQGEHTRRLENLGDKLDELIRVSSNAQKDPPVK